MPDPIPVPITPPPGIVKTETGKVAAGRWTDGAAVHFVRGLPQKIGGWVRQRGRRELVPFSPPENVTLV
jgi:hypothetical protein